MDNRTIDEIRINEDRLIDKNIELENINDKLSSALNSAEQLLNLYKSVIEEIREYEENSSFDINTRDFGRITVCDSNELSLILDKVNIKKVEE